MKQVLIFHSDQPSIADLQSLLQDQCYIYATTRRKMVLEFLKNNPVDFLIIHLPSDFDKGIKHESQKLLKQLRHRDLKKIIICSETEEERVKDFLKLGVTAIVGPGEALRVVLGVAK